MQAKKINGKGSHFSVRYHNTAGGLYNNIEDVIDLQNTEKK